jgi:hypothetical protein
MPPSKYFANVGPAEDHMVFAEKLSQSFHIAHDWSYPVDDPIDFGVIRSKVKVTGALNNGFR